MSARRLALALLLLAGPALAQAPTPGTVGIAGAVARPASYTIEALAARPTLAVTVPLENGRSATFVGPLLWPILQDAAPIDAPGGRTFLQHVLIGRGADGYGVAVAVGEIDPNFEGKPVILAFKRDGELLAQPRLVVPGDAKPGRSVRDLVAIEVH